MDEVTYQRIPLDILVPFFPPMRITKDDAEDRDFQASLRKHGIRDTLLVRPHPTRPNFLEVVDGNRRLAHGRVVGLEDAPCEIREMTDEEAFFIALIRNVQRSNVTSIAIGNWLQLIQMKFQYSQQKLAEEMGKSQSWISRHLKLITSEVSDSINVKSEFQARAFRSAPEEIQQQILDTATEAGELPSGREIMRKSQVTMSVEEVMNLYSVDRYEEEFVVHQLQVKAGKTATEARDLVWDHKNRRRVKRSPSPIINSRDKTVRVFEQLTRYYPVNVIDLVAQYTNSTNLETLIKYCRNVTQKMFEIAPPELRQTVIQSFI